MYLRSGRSTSGRRNGEGVTSLYVFREYILLMKIRHGVRAEQKVFVIR